MRGVAIAEEAPESECLRLRLWIRGKPERPSTKVVAITAGPGSNAVNVARGFKRTREEMSATLPRR